METEAGRYAYDRVIRPSGGYAAYVQKYSLALYHFLGDLQVTQHLLDHGAKVEAINASGRTPFLEAVYRRNVPCSVVNLFIERGANVFARHNGCTALDIVFQEELSLFQVCEYIGLDIFGKEVYQNQKQTLLQKVIVLTRVGVSTNCPVGTTKGSRLYYTLRTMVFLCVYQNRTKFLSHDCLRCLHTLLLG
jgi:hypothetical protein